MTALIARQHLLPSILWLVEELRKNGFSSLAIEGKEYSTVPEVRKQLAAIDGVTVDDKRDFNTPVALLDEGGDLHRALPPDLGHFYWGVEQTTSGLQPTWKCPMVLVCRSAAKLMFESQIIVRGILRKLESLGALNGVTVGVIGLGALGSQLARALANRGVTTYGTDVNGVPTDLRALAVDLHTILEQCDVLLGCTGSDSLATENCDVSGGGRKTLISCSSSDVEFRSVLKKMRPSDGFGSRYGWIGKTHYTVLNGGFPINFDRTREWEAFHEIILTRRLVLEGLIQARQLAGSAARGVMLSPETQLRVVNDWIQQLPRGSEINVTEPLTEAFFRKHSEGQLDMQQKPAYKLHSTTPGALAKMRSHTQAYDVEVVGMRLLVLPNVWSPAYDWSSLLYLENMPEVTGLDFLEIGCGTGVISVFAAKRGARHVVAADLNPDAVKNTALNFSRFEIEHGKALLSDGFTNIKGKFDVVSWNAPYHGNRPSDLLERGCADEDYRDIRRFFREVPNYLRPGAIVLFGFSESGDLPLIETLIAENGFTVRRKLSDWRQGYNCMLFDLVRLNLPAGLQHRIS